MNIQLSPEDQLILLSVKLQSNNADLEHFNNLIPLISNWDYVVNTIIERGIGPLLFKKLPLLTSKEMIPMDVYSKLQQAYFKTLTRSIVLYDAFRKIADIFTANNISAIALKGIYLSEWLYGDVGLRQFSDIDLLVKPHDGQKCLTLLTELGFQAVKNQNVSDYIESKARRVHFPPMVLGGISVEIHTKLHSDNNSYNVRVDECWKNAISVTINNCPFMALNDVDLLIHLCVHLDKHFRDGHVQFTCFNDITNLLDKLSDTLDWDELLIRCRYFNCELVVMKYLVLSNIYFKATLPLSISELYKSQLTVEDEQLFYKYLHGYTFENVVKSAIPTHFENLRKLDSNKDFCKYMIDVVFPPKSFMLEKYNIKNPSFYLLYYPYRYLMGLKGLLTIIFSPFTNK